MTPPSDPDDEFVEPEPCPCCGGTGWLPGDDDEDDETVVCPLCGGTGEDGP